MGLTTYLIGFHFIVSGGQLDSFTAKMSGPVDVQEGMKIVQERNTSHLEGLLWRLSPDLQDVGEMVDPMQALQDSAVIQIQARYHLQLNTTWCVVMDMAYPPGGSPIVTYHCDHLTFR